MPIISFMPIHKKLYKAFQINCLTLANAVRNRLGDE